MDGRLVVAGLQHVFQVIVRIVHRCQAVCHGIRPCTVVLAAARGCKCCNLFRRTRARLTLALNMLLTCLCIALQSWKKPFNPLLGETWQAQQAGGGCQIFMEQLSHHPPISAFEMIGPGELGCHIANGCCLPLCHDGYCGMWRKCQTGCERLLLLPQVVPTRLQGTRSRMCHSKPTQSKPLQRCHWGGMLLDCSFHSGAAIRPAASNPVHGAADLSLQGYRCLTFADDGTNIDIVYPSYHMRGELTGDVDRTTVLQYHGCCRFSGGNPSHLQQL